MDTSVGRPEIVAVMADMMCRLDDPSEYGGYEEGEPCAHHKHVAEKVLDEAIKLGVSTENNVTWKNAYNGAAENARRVEAKLRECRKEVKHLRREIKYLTEEEEDE